MESQDYNLKAVWDAILAVYVEFAKVCERHNLRFYLTDGTAIGAVRHHGFIPWDDDLDVSMPREDYDEFMRIAPSELPSHLCCISIGKTQGYSNLHGKVQETRRDVVEDAERKAGYTLSSGIFIDILPIDGWSGSKILYAINKIRFFLFDRVCDFALQGLCNRSWKGRLSWLCGALLRPFYRGPFDAISIALGYQNIYGVHKCEGMPSTARVRCWLNRRLILRPDIWGKAVYVDFCGIRAPLPEKYDEYLRQDYGDYMKLPPIEKRKTTHSSSGVHCPWWLGPTNSKAE